MVRDRLPDLVRYTESFPHRFNRSASANEHVQIEIDQGDGPDYRDIERVFLQFDGVQEGVHSIRYNVKSMRNILADMTTTIQYQKLGALLEEKRQSNLTTANKMYSEMKRIEAELPEKGDFTTLARIKMCQYLFHREDFMRAWTEHEEFLLSYEDRMKKLLIRQAKIVDANLNEEELESLLENHTTSLFVGNILQETVQERQKLQDLMVRHNELQKIEKSLIEVRDLFIRISALVMEQSEQIDRIENFATQTSARVEKGGGALDKARKLKIKVLKKKTWLWIWIIGILLVIILLMAIF